MGINTETGEYSKGNPKVIFRTALKEKAKAKCKKAGITLSDYMRLLLERDLQKTEPQQD